MENDNRAKAEELIKKILEKKSFLVLNEDEKQFLFDTFSEDMKRVTKNYDEYLKLSDALKLEHIVMVALKEYMGSWHVTPEQMVELSEYVQAIAKSEA